MNKQVQTAEKQIISLIKRLQLEHKTLNYNEFNSVLTALKKIYKNEKLLGHLIKTIDAMRNKEISGSKNLTNREQQVLLLIGRGFQNQSIASSLNLSKSTVETHRKNIRKKLKLASNDNLLVFAMIYSLQNHENN